LEKEKKGEIEITASFAQSINLGSYEVAKPMVAAKRILNKGNLPIELIECYQRELLSVCEKIIKEKIRQLKGK